MSTKDEEVIRKLEIGSVIQAYRASGSLDEYDVLDSQSTFLGKEFKNYNGEVLKVLACVRLKDNNKATKKFLVEFKKTHTQLVVSHTPITNGQVKDPYSPSVYNTGFMGQGIYHVNTHLRLYRLWTQMLFRCYDEEHRNHNPSYKGCSVDPRWHNFQNFCEDIQLLENYGKWLEGCKEKKNPYELDKDLLVKGNRVYSKDTCMFLTQAENSRVSNLGNKHSYSGKTFKCTNLKTGEYELFYSIRKFAEETGFPRGGIAKCLKGVFKEYRGFGFEIASEKLYKDIDIK